MSDKNQESVDFKVDLTKTPEEIQKEPEAKEEKPKEETEDKPEGKAPESISEKGGELSDKQKIIKDYLSSTYNIDESQLKDVLKNNEQQVELPEDVAKYLQFREETGRGLNDFLLAQQDFSEMDDFDLVGTYLAQTNPEYSDDDIAFFMEDKFIPAEGEEERSARSKALAMKQELQKAKENHSNLCQFLL